MRCTIHLIESMHGGQIRLHACDKRIEKALYAFYGTVHYILHPSCPDVQTSVYGSANA